MVVTRERIIILDNIQVYSFLERSLLRFVIISVGSDSNVVNEKVFVGCNDIDGMF